MAKPRVMPGLKEEARMRQPCPALGANDKQMTIAGTEFCASSLVQTCRSDLLAIQ